MITQEKITEKLTIKYGERIELLTVDCGDINPDAVLARIKNEIDVIRVRN